jgi:hypothetical protein
VIVGKDHTVARQSDIPCVVIPCSTDCGDLYIEIAIKPSTTQPGEKAVKAAASA